MTAKTILTLLALALTATGCGGLNYDQRKFYRDDTTEAQFQKDSYECERDMLTVGRFGDKWSHGDLQRAFALRCMAAKGYVYR